MDTDPMQFVEEEADKKESAVTAAGKSKAHLNTMVAISVALLATFMGVCKVKDDNIVQAMQQAQADKIDNYGWYQARNIREEIATSTVAQLKVVQTSASPQASSSTRPSVSGSVASGSRHPRLRWPIRLCTSSTVTTCCTRGRSGIPGS